MKNTILRNINRDIIIRTQSDKCRVSRFSKSLKSLCSREHTTWKILPGGQTLLEFRLSQLKIDQGRHCQTGRSCSAVLAEYFYRRCEKEIAKFLALKNVVRGQSLKREQLRSSEDNSLLDLRSQCLISYSASFNILLLTLYACFYLEHHMSNDC